MPALSDYLLKSSPAIVQANLYVRLVNNVTGTSYISDAVTDANGKYTFAGAPPPPGIYTVYTGSAATIPGTPNATGDTNYLVPDVNAAADVWSTKGFADLQTAINSVAASAAGAGELWIGGLVTITAVINLKPGVNFRGNYSLSYGAPSAQKSEVRQLTAGQNILNTYDSGNVAYEIQQIRLQGVLLTGGTNGIECSNGAVQLWLIEVTIVFHSGIGLHLKGFCQEIMTRDLEIAGGTKGITHTNENGTATTNKLLDKCSFRGTWCHGQSINGIDIEVTRSYNVYWQHLRVQVAGQHGVVLGGALIGWSIENWNCESNGVAPGVAAAVTTATTTSGSAAVTVASGAGLPNGTVVTIAGAGVAGADWYPTILSGGLTANLVMTTTAPTTVAARELTAGLYSDLKIVQVGGSGPHGLVITAGTLGYQGATSSLRYSIDASVSGGIILIAPGNGSRPVYDPLGVVSLPHGAEDAANNITACPIRRPFNSTNDSMSTPSFGGGLEAWRSLLPSPIGGNIVLALRDTTGTGGGTYGLIEVRKSNGARTRVLYIDNVGGVYSQATIRSGDGANSIQLDATGLIQQPYAPNNQPAWDVNHASAASVPVIRLGANVLTAIAATAGANGATPAQVKGYLPVTWTDGTTAKIPVYAN